MKILTKMRPESYRKADELANNTKRKDETPQIIEQDNKNFHQGDVSAAERRILFAKWVGNTWKRLSPSTIPKGCTDVIAIVDK